MGKAVSLYFSPSFTAGHHKLGTPEGILLTLILSGVKRKSLNLQEAGDGMEASLHGWLGQSWTVFMLPIAIRFRLGYIGYCT